MPLSLGLFQQSPFISMLVNLWAIPWVGWLVLPLALLGDICFWLFEWPYGLQLAGLSIEWLLAVLQWVFDAGLTTSMLSPEPWVWWLCVLLALWWVIPLPWQGRLWVPAILAGLTLQQPQPLSQAKLTVLDVGQGLAVVLQDAENAWLYDSGNAYPSGFNLGEAVVVPFLRHHGVNRLDSLVLSHNDEDHIRGAEYVMSEIFVSQLLGSGADRFSVLPKYKPCRSGQVLPWGSGQVTVLWPPAKLPFDSDNDASCVVLWQINNLSVLIPGDISQKVERAILARHPDLKADIIVLAHHGSNSSSGWQWLVQLSPQVVVISSGYRNAYGHPHPKVLARLEALHIPVWNTAEKGAVTVQLSGTQPVVSGYRDTVGRFWFDQSSESHNGVVLSDGGL